MKENNETYLSVIDEAVKGDKLIIGFKNVIKSLQEGKVSEVLLCSGGKYFINKIELVAGETPIKVINETPKSLGILCKKPFNITVLGIKIKKIEKVDKPTKISKLIKPEKKVIKKRGK